MPVEVVGMAPTCFKDTDIHKISPGRDIETVDVEPDGTVSVHLRDGYPCGLSIDVEANRPVRPSDRYGENWRF